MVEISIIIPSFNHELFLADRLNSILNQTFTDWQLIIIDDKSSDNSLFILTEFYMANKERVKHFVVNETNSGSGYFSWKKGIELADTEYIWIAETDDYSDEMFLEEQIRILKENPNCSLTFCATNYVDDRGNLLYTSENRTRNLEVKENEYKVFSPKYFCDRMPFNTLITNGSSVVFRKPQNDLPQELFVHRQCSDLFLWTYLLKSSTFGFLNKKLNYFRRHDESTTTRISMGRGLRDTYRELAAYVVYFNGNNEMNRLFVKMYFNNYVRVNKFDVFNLSVFQGNFALKVLYLRLLIPMIFKIIINGKRTSC
jgi:glycosyltransferase involved in cell wall biosynthesis